MVSGCSVSWLAYWIAQIWDISIITSALLHSASLDQGQQTFFLGWIISSTEFIGQQAKLRLLLRYLYNPLKNKIRLKVEEPLLT